MTIIYTGVLDVLSFDDQIIIAETDLGLLTIKGENLKINKLRLWIIRTKNKYIISSITVKKSGVLKDFLNTLKKSKIRLKNIIFSYIFNKKYKFFY